MRVDIDGIDQWDHMLERQNAIEAEGGIDDGQTQVVIDTMLIVVGC